MTIRGTGFAGPTVRRILQEPLLPELGGVLPPSISPLIPHRVLLHLNLAALSHHDGGGAQQILEELHRGVLPVTPQAFPQRGAQQAPQQEACQLVF